MSYTGPLYLLRKKREKNTMGFKSAYVQVIITLRHSSHTRDIPSPIPGDDIKFVTVAWLENDIKGAQSA